MFVETLLSSYILRVNNYESMHVIQYIKDTVGAWPYLKMKSNQSYGLPSM